MTSTITPCKDAMFEHPRMRCCDLLSQLPPSLPLDGINAEVLITNQPRWLNSATAEEMMESKVLIPVPGGPVEFYASKMVPEDQSLIDYVVSQCNTLSEQGAMINVNNNNNMNVSQVQTGDFSPYSPSTALANLDLSCGEATATADRIRICNSAMNFLQQFSYLTETPCSNSNNKDDEDDNNDDLLAHSHGAPPTHDHTRTRSRSRSHVHTPTQLQHEIIMNGNGYGNDNEEEDGDQEEQEKGLMKQQHTAGPRGDSGSDSDAIDDEDDSKYGGGNGRRKNGKGTSKNLMAERKRRKKLNERLYLLRSLVPKISKLDRAAILGDAIEYVMELQQQVRDLQNELEHNSEDDDDNSLITNTNLPSMEYSGSLNLMDNSAVGGFCAAPSASSTLKRGAVAHDDTNTCSVYDHHKPQQQQQMEVQVEVAHLDGNEFFIKVFGEQKGVSFVSLMEALHSLGLEVTTVNGTSCISLVSYVFTVEKKDNEVVQAEYLRESLLQMTRNQTSEWAKMAKPTGGVGGQLDQFQHNQYFQHHHFHPFQ